MYDLVIVGSGATALYLAYQIRLLNLNAIVVTADPHVGGRIISKELSNTVIDKCATRFYRELMPLVTALVDELKVPTYLLPEVPVLTPTGSEIVQQVLQAYPPEDTPHPELIPLNWAITTSTTAGFADVNRLALESGYTFIANNVNVNFLYHDFPLSGLDETKFVNGFQSFMEAIYQELTLPVKFETIVHKVVPVRNCASQRVGYMLNTVDKHSKYSCLQAKKVVYTGTIPQLSSIILPEALQERADILRRSFNVDSGLKIFIKFDRPWWNGVAKYTGNPLFNQLIYVSDNVLELYMVGNMQADMIEQVTTGKLGRFITPADVPQLMEQIYRQIPIITGADIPVEQLTSASSLIVWYSDVALNTAVPGPLLSDEVRYKDGFYLVSGDMLDYGQGWVENAFRAVELFLAQGHLNSSC